MKTQFDDRTKKAVPPPPSGAKGQIAYLLLGALEDLEKIKWKLLICCIGIVGLASFIHSHSSHSKSQQSNGTEDVNKLKEILQRQQDLIETQSENQQRSIELMQDLAEKNKRPLISACIFGQCLIDSPHQGASMESGSRQSDPSGRSSALAAAAPDKESISFPYGGSLIYCPPDMQHYAKQVVDLASSSGVSVPKYLVFKESIVHPSGSKHRSVRATHPDGSSVIAIVITQTHAEAVEVLKGHLKGSQDGQ